MDHKDGAGALTTPERLDRMAAFMAKRTAERQAAFQRRADAVKRFYAVLGPEQKRAFDALHEHAGGGGGRAAWAIGGGPGEDGRGGGGHEHGWDRLRPVRFFERPPPGRPRPPVRSPRSPGRRRA